MSPNRFWSAAEELLRELIIDNADLQLPNTPHKAAFIDGKGRLIFSLNYETKFDGLALDKYLKINRSQFTFLEVHTLRLLYQDSHRYQLSVYLQAKHPLCKVFDTECRANGW
jgi:hypothetical protein